MLHFENKYCKIVSPSGMPGVYKVVSKKGMYNDQYYQSLASAKMSIGINPNF